MDADAWDSRYAAQDLLWSVEPNRFVAGHLAGLPPGRALDLACGEGRNARWLAASGWAVTAVDFSPVAVARAKDLDRAGRVDFQVRDVTSWPVPPAAYDLVLIAYLHLPRAEMSALLGAAARALVPGGTLFFVGHDRTNLTDGTGGPKDPAILHDPDEIAADLGALDVVRAERVHRPVGDATAVDTLVRAVRNVP